MTAKRKYSNIWHRHRGAIWTAIILLALFPIFMRITIHKNTTLLAAGVTVNVSLSKDAEQYLKTIYHEELTTWEKVSVNSMAILNAENPASIHGNYNTVRGIIALSKSGELDYILMDEYALESLIGHDPFMDLRQIFPVEMLSALGRDVIYIRNKAETSSKPVAINITNLPFIQDGTEHSSAVYISFTADTPRKEVCCDIWEYINAWQQ